jgi:hypothetical protein
VLPMSALKFSDPVTLSVDIVINNLSLHANIIALSAKAPSNRSRVLGSWRRFSRFVCDNICASLTSLVWSDFFPQATVRAIRNSFGCRPTEGDDPSHLALINATVGD